MIDPQQAAPGLSGSLSGSQSGSVLVYRDRLVPRSEAHFLRRLYLGFDQLAPVWIGCRRDDGLADLGAPPLILGGDGLFGPIARFLFKQFGMVPSVPDLAPLRPRVLHAHFGRGGALALPLARRLRLPLVVTFHGGDATKAKHYRRQWPPTLYQRRLAALQREGSAFLCVSGFIRDALLARGFPPERTHVLYNGVEIEGLAPPERAPERPYILFAGRLVAKKGAAFLVQAMRRLHAEGQDLDLVLIGDGPEAAALRQSAAGLPNIRFLGWQSNAEVRAWMRGALAVCIPSVTAPNGDAEGLPTVAIEAMAQAVPVIGSRSAGIGEAIDDGRTGLLVPPGDAAALAAAIRALLLAPERRQGMASAARRMAETRFNALTQSRRLQEILLAHCLSG